MILINVSVWCLRIGLARHCLISQGLRYLIFLCLWATKHFIICPKWILAKVRVWLIEIRVWSKGVWLVPPEGTICCLISCLLLIELWLVLGLVSAKINWSWGLLLNIGNRAYLLLVKLCILRLERSYSLLLLYERTLAVLLLISESTCVLLLFRLKWACWFCGLSDTENVSWLH